MAAQRLSCSIQPFPASLWLVAKIMRSTSHHISCIMTIRTMMTSIRIMKTMKTMLPGGKREGEWRVEYQYMTSYKANENEIIDCLISAAVSFQYTNWCGRDRGWYSLYCKASPSARYVEMNHMHIVTHDNESGAGCWVACGQKQVSRNQLCLLMNNVHDSNGGGREQSTWFDTIIIRLSWIMYMYIMWRGRREEGRVHDLMQVVITYMTVWMGCVKGEGEGEGIYLCT